MRFAPVGLLLLLSGAPASACTLTFTSEFQGRPERIAAIELVLKHAAITGIHPIPVGWRLRVDNDPSWNTKAIGRAVVGAAFLDASGLSGMISIGPEPNYTCGDLATSGYVAVKLKVYRNDQLHDIIVQRPSWRVAD